MTKEVIPILKQESKKKKTDYVVKLGDAVINKLAVKKERLKKKTDLVVKLGDAVMDKLAVKTHENHKMQKKMAREVKTGNVKKSIKRAAY